MTFAMYALFEGGFLTAVRMSSLYIGLVVIRIFHFHSDILLIWSFSHFQMIDLFLPLEDWGGEEGTGGGEGGGGGGCIPLRGNSVCILFISS